MGRDQVFIKTKSINKKSITKKKKNYLKINIKFVLDKFEFFFCGNNEYGESGNNSNSTKLNIEKITVIDKLKLKIKKITCGFGFSVFLTGIIYFIFWFLCFK
jgi:hypothetical protein